MLSYLCAMLALYAVCLVVSNRKLSRRIARLHAAIAYEPIVVRPDRVPIGNLDVMLVADRCAATQHPRLSGAPG